jgi:hypothetical protein
METKKIVFISKITLIIYGYYQFFHSIVKDASMDNVVFGF